jgi:hypothetical protein
LASGRRAAKATRSHSGYGGTSPFGGMLNPSQTSRVSPESRTSTDTSSAPARSPVISFSGLSIGLLHERWRVAGHSLDEFHRVRFEVEIVLLGRKEFIRLVTPLQFGVDVSALSAAVVAGAKEPHDTELLLSPGETPPSLGMQAEDGRRRAGQLDRFLPLGALASLFNEGRYEPMGISNLLGRLPSEGVHIQVQVGQSATSDAKQHCRGGYVPCIAAGAMPLPAALGSAGPSALSGALALPLA